MSMTWLIGPRGVREEIRQLDISTLLTPAAGHLVCCYLGGCPEEVRDLVDCPVMLLLGTGVTSADIIMSVIMSVSQLS